MSQTNDTTRAILNFFFSAGIFSYRQNTTGIPISGGGFRPAAKTGLPDIIAILPPSGTYLGVEIKTGKDKLSDVQIGTHMNIRKMGGIVLVVKDYQDFLTQWNALHI